MTARRPRLRHREARGVSCGPLARPCRYQRARPRSSPDLHRHIPGVGKRCHAAMEGPVHGVAVATPGDRLVGGMHGPVRAPNRTEGRHLPGRAVVPVRNSADRDHRVAGFSRRQSIADDDGSGTDPRRAPAVGAVAARRSLLGDSRSSRTLGGGRELHRTGHRTYRRGLGPSAVRGADGSARSEPAAHPDHGHRIHRGALAHAGAVHAGPGLTAHIRGGNGDCAQHRISRH